MKHAGIRGHHQRDDANARHDDPKHNRVVAGADAHDVRHGRRPRATGAHCGATPVLERWSGQRCHRQLRRARNDAGQPDVCASGRGIATFDNDVTLWGEQPIYVQLAFALDRVKAMSPQHPEWKDTQPFKAVVDGDQKALAASGEQGLAQIMAVTHAGQTTDEFDDIVREWFATARHPKSGRLYTEMVYQPMLELLAYLRANGFKTFIVSGGGVEFMRRWTERV